MILQRSKFNGRRAQGLRNSIQGALTVLGIDRRAVYRNANRAGTRRPLHGVAESFWAQPPGLLWNLLELARSRYRHEIAASHPDRGGTAERAVQLNWAWSLVRDHFRRRGFELW